MKFIDEVAALSSVEALESLCAPITDGRRAAITQNLNALRDQLQGYAKPVAWRMRYEEPSGGWSDWLVLTMEPRGRASINTEIEPLYAPIAGMAGVSRG